MWFDIFNIDFLNKIIIIIYVLGDFFYDNILFNFYLRKRELREVLFIMKKSVCSLWIILMECIL